MIDAIISGSYSDVLAIKTARILDIDLIRTEVKKFPDGETYVRIPTSVEGKKIAVIQSMAQYPNENLIEYFLTVNTLKDLGAKEVIGVIPYFAYARQDERFKEGEAISLKIIAQLIEKSGTDAVITVDMHRHRVFDMSDIFSIPVTDLSAVGELTKYMSKYYKMENPAVIGPDAESEAWAKIAARILNTDYYILSKQRFSGTEVKVSIKDKLNVENRDVFIVDDIISTGGTIVNAMEILKEHGAKDIYVACTHPILVMHALARIYEKGAKVVIGTDTVNSPISFVSVAPVIAEELQKY